MSNDTEIRDCLRKTIMAADAGAEVILIERGNREGPVTATTHTEDGKITIRVTVELIENENPS